MFHKFVFRLSIVINALFGAVVIYLLGILTGAMIQDEIHDKKKAKDTQRVGPTPFTNN